MPQAGGAAAGLPGNCQATVGSPCPVREGADGTGAWAQGGGNSQVQGQGGQIWRGRTSGVGAGGGATEGETGKLENVFEEA